MRYFTPELMLGVLLPEETELVEKFGGLPYGLPSEKWPLCKSCGKPLSHLFTLKHDADRLDLGKAGRVLLAFMCNHEPGMCETWDMDSGANAVLVLAESELGIGLTEAPGEGTKTETEAFIVSWRQAEETVSEVDEAAFFDEQAYYDLPCETRDAVYQLTKLGGLPIWLQSAGGPSVPPFRFVGQFDYSLIFQGQPPSAANAFCPVYRWNKDTKETHADLPPKGWLPPPGGPSAIRVSDDSHFHCDGPEYGSDGIAYLFLSALSAPNLFDANPPMDEKPQAKFLWQHT